MHEYEYIQWDYKNETGEKFVFIIIKLRSQYCDNTSRV